MAHAAFALSFAVALAGLVGQDRPGELEPVDRAIALRSPDGQLLQGESLMARVPESTSLQMLRLQASAPEVLLAVHADEGGMRARTVRAAEKSTASGVVESICVDKELPASVAMRLDDLWRAMLLRARFRVEDRGGRPEGESFVFSRRVASEGPWAARAADPAAGTAAARLCEVGRATMAYVEAPIGEASTAALARLEVAIITLEVLLAPGAVTGAVPPGSGDGEPAKRDVDLRPTFLKLGLQPRPQGARPTCSIFTTVAAFEFALARALGHGERLSAEYCNWAANAATGRRDDGDFFHCALAGWDKYGMCRDTLWPYAAAFDGAASPAAEALVDGGRVQQLARQLRVRWVKPIGTGVGLDEAQLADVHATLAAGWPIAAGSSHSRLLVGYRADANVDGGGVFLSLDSALNRFDEVTAAFVRDAINDAFVVDLRP